MLKVGDTIKIVNMSDEPQYAGKEGVVEHISTEPWGDLRADGTWGGCALYPKVDTYTIIKRADDGE